MDGARQYNGKRNKLVRERQIPYDFTRMWELRNKTKRERERERDEPRNKLLTLENKLVVSRGEVDGGMVK